MLIQFVITGLLLLSSATACAHNFDRPVHPSKGSGEHAITAVLDFSEKVEMEDGSQWKIAPADAYKIVGWSKGDRIVITPNQSWLSFYSFDYCLTNTTQNSYVKANLFSTPLPFGPQTHWITSLDKFGGFVFLENGSCWKVSKNDHASLQEWTFNDAVILGVNDDWLSQGSFILINARLKQYVHASEF